jgi:hypothetical protein
MPVSVLKLPLTVPHRRRRRLVFSDATQLHARGSQKRT